MRFLRASVKAAFITIYAIIMMASAIICSVLRTKKAKQLAIRQIYHWAAFILGMRITVKGTPDTTRPMLLVTNHVSYSDVVVLGSIILPCFTPKADVKAWPVIGTLCKVTDCVFIDRKRHKTKENKESLMASLSEDNCICIFPEATTGTGLQLLPFHSSYFSLAQEQVNGTHPAVQPAAIIYSKVNGKTFDESNYRSIAWIGDDEFFPHLWQFLSLKTIEVCVTFLPATTLQEHSDRKALSAYCEDQIKLAIHKKRRPA